jgi:23S rRNA (cytosine1962-C5)-methyltransferase
MSLRERSGKRAEADAGTAFSLPFGERSRASRVAALVLKRGAGRRLLAGHAWVYRGEIADLRGRWSAEDAVDVLDADGRRLGRGFYNPRTSLACRLLTRSDEDVGAALFRQRLEAALAFRRSNGLTASAYRLCWSEADGLPGLVVDRYAKVSVFQCLTLGMARRASWVAEALDALFAGDPMLRSDDATAARIEGFVPEQAWIRPPPPSEAHFDSGPASAPSPAAPRLAHLAVEMPIAEGACHFDVQLGSGHKTGFYLDQRENRLLVAAHGAGRRMLDAFCYTGAFACHALRAGAPRALLVDISGEALAVAARHLMRNGVADRADLREGNAFDVLRALGSGGERFGLVVLDPPPFTRRKEALDAASRGYKEINLRALRLLEPGGLLATFSCSHHVTPALFEDICRAAAGDAGVITRVRAVLGQSGDHPVILNIPETRYLTGLLLERA